MNFEEIYKNLFKRVLAYIVSRTGNITAAEDIACRTWQKAWDKQHQFNSKKETPEQWIFTIARNEVNVPTHMGLLILMTEREMPSHTGPNATT